MEKEIIRRNILDYKEVLRSRRFVPRDLQIDYAFLRETGKVAAILGPRRAGKSTFLLQIADSHDLEDGARIHIDFSEIVWSEFAGADPEEWTRLYEVALSLHRHPVFLLDEIQEVADFSKGVRTLTNRGCPVFLTGSNAELFHRELSTVLRGKVLTYTLFPLSFAEFLRFRGKTFGASLSTREAADRRDLLLEYLAWGGFPEVVIADTPELKRSLLESYLDVMLFRDVVERHSVQNIQALERVVRKALLGLTKEISVHRWYNELQSEGVRVGKDTLYGYLSNLQEAFFFFVVKNLAAPTGNRKVYLVDNGLYSRVRNRPDLGKLLENQVFVDLLRQGCHPHFLRNDDGEIDFITDDWIVQVCLELSDANRRREEQPLADGTTKYPNREAAIVTLDNYPEFAGSLEHRG